MLAREGDLFLAHVGSVPQFAPLQGLAAESVAEDTLHEFAKTRLMAFADSEAEPDADKVRDEVDRRQAELAGTGRGALACFHGEPVGITWWYDQGDDM
jgi:hypothetical protein